ncbi:hypothetical protein AMK59_6059, partial [Oryctes borbonicus]
VKMLLKLLRLRMNYQYKNVRLLCSEKSAVNNETPARKNIEFVPVYQLPSIRVFSVLNRLKLYQTIITLTAIPVVLTFNGIGFVSKEAVLTTVFIGLAGMIPLYSLGILSTKLIGIVYLSEDGTTVKVSSIDFWGKRKDDLIPINDIVPISDLPISMTDALYLKFTQFSKIESLKINLKFGVVLNKDGFNKIFR